MFYVPPRLKELNFEVNVYDNYKQEEVLDIINQGEHARVQTEINVRRPVQSFLKNTLSPQPPRPIIRTSTALCWSS